MSKDGSSSRVAGFRACNGLYLTQGGSKAVFGSVPVYHWTATSGWIPENPLNRVGDGDNKFLLHGYLVSILDQQGGVSCDMEAGWPSLRH